MIKRILCCIAALHAMLNLTAQQYTLLLYSKEQLPTPAVNTEKWDTSNYIRISGVTVPEIAVYLPTARASTGQAVVICPGGGYSILAYDWEGTDVAKLLNAKGIAAIVLKYRLPDPARNGADHNLPMLDAQRAMQMVRAMAPKWNIHRDKIGLMGFSAGGHVASTAGTRFNTGNPNAADSVERFSSRPDFLILVYPVITMSESFMHQGSRNNLIGKTPDAARAKLYSNDQQVTAQTPPTFLIHATDDNAVPVENSLRFYEALKKAGVSAEMHIYPKGGHGFSLALGMGHLETWPERCIDWIRSLIR